MKFIAGNQEFANNAKQLIPDTTIFDRMILDLPTTHKGILWDHNTTLGGEISSGTGDNIIYRSAYYLYLDNHETIETITEDNVTNNVFTLDVWNKIEEPNVSLNDIFDTWAIVQVSENTYLFFIWFDLEQEFTLRWTEKDDYDWYLQVVI